MGDGAMMTLQSDDGKGRTTNSDENEKEEAEGRGDDVDDVVRIYPRHLRGTRFADRPSPCGAMGVTGAGTCGDATPPPCETHPPREDPRRSVAPCDRHPATLLQPCRTTTTTTPVAGDGGGDGRHATPMTSERGRSCEPPSHLPPWHGRHATTTVVAAAENLSANSCPSSHHCRRHHR